MTWPFLVLLVLLVLIFLSMGIAMTMRGVLRRRVAKAEKALPGGRLTGPAVLVGTNVDESLRGVGAMVATDTELVFVLGTSGDRLAVPLGRAVARGYRQKPNQRVPSLRLDWDGLAAVFDVQKPGLDEWLAVLPAARIPD